MANPFAVLGLTIDATDEEILRRRKELLVLSRIGESPSYPIDVLSPEKIDRNESDIAAAAQALADPQRRIQAELNWLSKDVSLILERNQAGTGLESLAKVFESDNLQSNDRFVLGSLHPLDILNSNKAVESFLSAGNELIGKQSQFFNRLKSSYGSDTRIDHRLFEKLSDSVEDSMIAALTTLIRNYQDEARAKEIIESIRTGPMGSDIFERIIDNLYAVIEEAIEEKLVDARAFYRVDLKGRSPKEIEAAFNQASSILYLEFPLLSAIAPYRDERAVLRPIAKEFNAMAVAAANAEKFELALQLIELATEYADQTDSAFIEQLTSNEHNITDSITRPLYASLKDALDIKEHAKVLTFVSQIIELEWNEDTISDLEKIQLRANTSIQTVKRKQLQLAIAIGVIIIVIWIALLASNGRPSSTSSDPAQDSGVTKSEPYNYQSVLPEPPAASQNSPIAEGQQEIASLKREIDVDSVSIATMDREIESMKSILDSENYQLDELKNRIDRLDTSNDSMVQKYKSLQDGYNYGVSTINDKIESEKQLNNDRNLKVGKYNNLINQ